ncbi:MAG: PepSY-associated TM helix domain-containing protein [Pirellulales bacterium]|nr:PepSY-associated TM helix domain-containing protein [Pirellulales bacterium]
MRFHRLNNIVHRDFGYFFAGTTLIYAISGLAVNHVNDWNPSFVVHREPIQTAAPTKRSEVDDDWIKSILASLREQRSYRGHDFPSDGKVKIYLEDASVFINLATGVGEYEVVKRRHVLYQCNRLHLSPKSAWLVFSDLFAASLIVVTLTGLFVRKGKYILTGRCLALMTAGVLVPVIFMLFV